MTDANVTFSSAGKYEPIYGFKSVYLSGCSLNPMTYYKTDANSYYVADKSGKGVKGDIVIKNRYYGTFGDVEINDKNASSIKPSDLKNGMIYLRDFAKGAGKYILLDNVDFLSTMHYGLYLDPKEECEFQIILRGKNTITASKPVFLSQKATPTVLIKPSASATDTPTLNLIQNKSSDYVMDVRCPELIFSNINLLIESKDGGSIGGYPSDRLLSFVNTKAEIFDYSSEHRGAIRGFKSVSYTDCYLFNQADDVWSTYNSYYKPNGDIENYIAINRGYGIFINAKDVTKDNKDDVLGDGKVSYNPSTKTLNLKGVNLSTSIANLHVFTPITINLTGANTLSATGASAAMEIYANTTITGSKDATLAVNTNSNGYSGIAVDQADLTIKDCDVSISSPKGLGIKGKWSILDKTLAGTSTLTLNNASLVINNSSQFDCILCLKNVTLTDCYYSNPTGAKFDPNTGEIRNGLLDIKGKLEISRGYGLSVGGTAITKDNCADLTGDGKIKYDPTTNTLTLNNASIGTEGNGIEAKTNRRLTINLIGYNSVASLRSYALYNNNNETGITITSSSNGNLSLNGGNGGSYQEAGELNISNCTVNVNGIYAKEGGNYNFITFENANVTSNSLYGAIKGMDYIYLYSCYVSEPTGAEFDFGKGGYVSGSKLCDKVVIKAGTSAIDGVTINANDNAPAYDLRGAKVNKSYRGIVIKNGHKYIQK